MIVVTQKNHYICNVKYHIGVISYKNTIIILI